MISEFFITFGQNHPLRYGYVLIRASTEKDARLLANTVLGKWSMIYHKINFKHSYFPSGQFGITLE